MIFLEVIHTFIYLYSPQGQKPAKQVQAKQEADDTYTNIICKNNKKELKITPYV